MSTTFKITPYIMKLTAEIFQGIYMLGLVMDIIGAFLVFKYGISPHYQKVAQQMRYSEAGYNQAMEDVKKYEDKAKLGFGLIIAGFLFQFIQSLYSLLVIHFWMS